MGDLATLPTFQPAPTGYTHTEFNAIFAALTIAVGAVTTNKLADQSVTFAKIQNVATNVLLGRSTAGSGVVEEITCTAFARTLLDDADAATGRTTLGLGTIATQAAGAVAITGGTINGTAIGGTTPAAGAFTTLSATGQVKSQTGSGITHLFGADVSATTITNATQKVARLGLPHYTNAEEPVTFALLDSSAGSTLLALGGGSGLMNAVQTVNIYAATGTTTTTGSLVASFTSTGLAVTGTLGSTGPLYSKNNGFSLGSGTTDGWYVDGAGSMLSSVNGAAAAYMRRRTSDGEIVRFYRDTSIVGNLSVSATGVGINASANLLLQVGGSTIGTVTSTGLAVTGTHTASGLITASAGLTVTGAVTFNTPLGRASGGTGLSAAPSNGQLLIGNGSGYTLATLTAGTNISITNGAGTITINASGGGGGTIGGSSGGTDNRLIRADGTGGATIQASAVTLDDSGNLTGANSYDAGTDGYKVSGTKVVGAQQGAIGDPSISGVFGSDTVHEPTVTNNFNSQQTAISSILSALRTHGLIAT